MTPEVCEVVVISGPRKGEIATIAVEVLPANGKNGHHVNDEMELTPEEEAALEVALQAAQQAAERATERAQNVATSMDLLLQELREVNRKLNEPI